MVQRHLFELATAQAVGPGIADVRNRDFVVKKHARDDGRAHTFAMSLALGSLVDNLVGPIDSVTQDD